MKNLIKTLGIITLALVIVFAIAACVSTTPSDTETPSDDGNDGVSLTPPIDLFNADGSYAVNKDSIVKGGKFSFFDYEWRVVNVKDNIATFWMDSPFAASKFTNPKESGVMQTADRTWNNGYFGAIWNSSPATQGQQLGTSAIRQFLLDAESIVIGTKAGTDKVIAGPLEEINQSNQTATITVNEIYYRRESLTHVQPSANGQNIIIDYSVGNSDKLWLPSYQEIKDGGIWGLGTVDRNWDNTTVSPCAWLRTPFIGNSERPANNCVGLLVGYSSETRKLQAFESVYFDYVDQQYGVRPAIHLDIHSANPDGIDY